MTWIRIFICVILSLNERHFMRLFVPFYRVIRIKS